MAKKKRRTAKSSRKSARRKRRVSGNNQYAPNVVSGMRRKTKRKKSRKRSRVGSVTGSQEMDTLLGALSGVVVGIGFDKVAPMLKLENALINDGIKTVGGGAAYLMVKNPFIKGMGLGLGIYGAASLAHSSGLVQGMEDFIRGIGNSNDKLLVEMNGTVDINSTNMIGEGQSEYAPSVVGGDDEINDVQADMPSVVSGY